MEIIIRDEEGNEEILPKPVVEKRGVIRDIILASIFLFSFLVLPWLFLAHVSDNVLLFWIPILLIIALLGYFVFFASLWDNITILDKGIETVQDPALPQTIEYAEMGS